jgi:hypothetical protein
MQMGMIDRGAPLQWCSQFPSEAEILFAPLTGLEVVGTPTVEQAVMIVELRLNCNLHDLTIEQILSKMQKVCGLYVGCVSGMPVCGVYACVVSSSTALCECWQQHTECWQHHTECWQHHTDTAVLSRHLMFHAPRL